MQKRYISIWFCYLKTDWHVRRKPVLAGLPFVLVTSSHGRMIITAASKTAIEQSVLLGMALADARAVLPTLQYFDDEEKRGAVLLNGLAAWCYRFTPVVAINLPDGLLLDVSGCPHLWGGETNYLQEIQNRLAALGYNVKLAMADTVGAAWAMARYVNGSSIVEPGMHSKVLLPLPPSSLRIEDSIAAQLDKLGLRQIACFVQMPRTALRRRFGDSLLQRLDEAMGNKEEMLLPVQPAIEYSERLPSMEPILTATGIRIALKRLLDSLCSRLQKAEKGLRKAIFSCYRTDGKTEQVSIGTNRPTCNPLHLFRLLEEHITTITPAPGIELFVLDAPVVEELDPWQEALFANGTAATETELAELLDRIAGKFGQERIRRFLPAEHYWPERSYKPANSLQEVANTSWVINKPRPLQLLPHPVLIQVTAPVPDYPPMNFRHNGVLHIISKADGPERIEAEWWLQEGLHRDYYYVEDESGKRYWIFRLGHYDAANNQRWYLHGYFS